MSDNLKQVTKHMDKGMSQQEAYAQLFVDAWRRKHPRKESNSKGIKLQELKENN